MRAEGIDRRPVSWLRQYIAARECGGDIISNGLIAGEIGRALPRDDGDELRIRKLVVLSDRDMA